MVLSTLATALAFECLAVARLLHGAVWRYVAQNVTTAAERIRSNTLEHSSILITQCRMIAGLQRTDGFGGAPSLYLLLRLIVAWNHHIDNS